MIAWLRGRLAHRMADALVVDVHGVGYQVFAPADLAARVVIDEDLELFVSTVVREDAFLLYGFATAEDRDAFEIIRGVNGVGPRIALALLGQLPYDELARAVNQRDVKAITRAHGVGKKLAERLCLELENKLQPRFSAAHAPLPAAPVAAEDPLRLALARLEYKRSEIDVALSSDKVPAIGAAPLEERLRASLQVLSRPL